ncbi:hypothetical protein [Methylobacterium sp. WL9]|uniref:hypothetical protein n=1 Tax=Methylobacterium sp. WL9 TaxID=2603898 RepID=UPI0011C84F74|nr:hypothetical protein [Methylobacterium sp. WL9]TXN25138.1 hypothetical protein FV217_00990 [Methylobacterium sp. WL9]
MKGVRTAKVVDMGGVPVVMTKDLPKGVHAMMLVDRIVAVRTATGRVVATVARARDALPCSTALPDAGESNETGAFDRPSALDAATVSLGA